MTEKFVIKEDVEPFDALNSLMHIVSAHDIPDAEAIEAMLSQDDFDEFGSTNMVLPSQLNMHSGIPTFNQ